MEAKSVEAQSRRWGLPCATDAPTLLCIVLYVPHACNTWVTRYNIADDEDEGDYDDDDAPFASCKAPMVAGGRGSDGELVQPHHLIRSICLHTTRSLPFRDRCTCSVSELLRRRQVRPAKLNMRNFRSSIQRVCRKKNMMSRCCTTAYARRCRQ